MFVSTALVRCFVALSLMAGPSSESAVPGGVTTESGDTVGEWWRGRVAAGEPGGVLVVRRLGEGTRIEARGVGDIETSAAIEPASAFYIASLAKPLTASVVERLAADGVVDPEERVGDAIPEIGILGRATVRQLMDQTAGVPDYFEWISFARLTVLDDAAVVDTLASHPEPLFAPGERFSYSNSNYVLVSEWLRRRTGRPLRVLVDETFGEPLRLSTVWIDDADLAAPPGVVEAYRPEGPGFRLSSYEVVDLPGDAPVVRMRFATTGAGGVFAGAPDLALWGEQRMIALRGWSGREPVLVPEEQLGSRIGNVRGYLEGWYVSDLAGRTVYWHDGNRGGFGSALAIVPAEGLTVVFLANRSDLVPQEIVEQALLEGFDE